MASSPKLFNVVGLLVLVLALTACALPRDGNKNSDLQPLEAMPPTLAPLGAESADLAAEATIVPTVINVQATATGSPLGQGEAAAAPDEELPATVQPILIPATPIASDIQQAGQAAPEVSVSDEPIVVDATTNSAPANEPIATNPPVSDTGNYGTTGYGEAAYTVQAGDTLFGIARRYGSTVEAIMVANSLSSDIVYAGQVLTVPAENENYAAPAAPAEPGFAEQSGGGQHTVGGGETLFRIALNYGTTVEAIAGANGIPYPYTIYPGQQLVIPSGEGYYPGPVQPSFDGNYPAYPYPPQDQGYYPMPGNDPMMPGMAGTHTVAPGETLHSIAQRYGTSAQAIANANGLMNPNQIYVGQVIYLP